MGEGEGRRAQDRNEDLSLADDASIGIDDGHGVACIVGLHHRARLVAALDRRWKAPNRSQNQV
ncbi:hypothetical protein X744_32595 [Mesorhizobium sp. LNJC372A00]|nr:hypothetical protein X744_32595 [Mesorhizobium sp. LNJC372A00]